MQFGSSRIVWIPARNNAGPARTAAAGGKVHIVEFQSLTRQAVYVRRIDLVVPVTTKIIPADIVGDDENNVRRSLGLVLAGDEKGHHHHGKKTRKVSHLRLFYIIQFCRNIQIYRLPAHRIFPDL